MFAGSNDGAYAAVKRLMAFVPCSLTVAHDATLFGQVVNWYDSNRRSAESTGLAAAPLLITFCVPHALTTPSRNRRPACCPADGTTPGDAGGAVPSSARVIVYEEIPIGTARPCESGPLPPP